MGQQETSGKRNEITHSLVQNLSDQWLATFTYGYPSSFQWHIIREGHKFSQNKIVKIYCTFELYYGMLK